MSCQYFVNNNWISEEEFKQVLANGLLDNLAADNTIELPNFKPDPTKVVKISKNKVISKNTSVSAIKLRDILVKEVTTRQGYPLSIIDALELNIVKKEDGSIDNDATDFKIPLWASPYASKFESLLTSVVTNKIVKQKFNGHSYVLGSPEGFKKKLREGAAAEKELSRPGIVFSENFDPELGLQAMRPDLVTGKMLPAQIMIPFSYRDEQGNILNLSDFTKVSEDGLNRTLIDFDKIPQKVLSLFGFRIPTQEQNSMAAVEIVGFLPEASGDLLLAPRDFTKQMGSDFDVDKLYTYMYNTYYKDGKLHTDFEGDLAKIETEREELLRELGPLKTELKLSKEEDAILTRYMLREELEEGEPNTLEKILKTLGKTPSAEIKAELNRISDRIAMLERSYVAYNQNKILDIHQKIMLSNTPEVISSVMSLDSPGEFEGLSKEAAKDKEPTISILSDIYQRTKYVNATAGKLGVGKFSLDSTLNASAQGKELVINNLGDDVDAKSLTYNEILAANGIVAAFGDVVSKGDLSNKYTLASQKLIKENRGVISKELRKKLKTKSVVIRSLQSAAVDNEKLQILDKLNINGVTFSSITALTMLGFEESDIAALLTSEIIWEFVDEMQRAESSFSGFNPNASENIIEALFNKYDPDGITSQESFLDAIKTVDTATLLEDRAENKLTPGISNDVNFRQLAALKKFQQLTEIGETIGNLQSSINTESKGLPSSLLENSQKLNQVSGLATSSIINAERLLGEFAAMGDKNVLINPTTINGFAVFYGTELANSIFRKYFPYNKAGFAQTLDEIAFHSKGESLMSQTAKTELAEEMFKGMKSFFFSSPETFLFSDNAYIERDRLFVDVEGGNMSLASILTELKNEPWYKSNGFLNKLSFSLNKNKTLSRVQFESTTGENFDERNIYLGFTYLIEKNLPIGSFNGIDYTTRLLAQDLIAAAYLEGGNQGATQYLKYIPQQFLTSIPFGSYLNAEGFGFQTSFGGMTIDNQVDLLNPSTFTRQFFQNNPRKAKVVELSDLKDKSATAPLHFELNDKAIKNNIIDVRIGKENITTQIKFLSIFDKNLPGKYAIYEFNEVTRKYDRIPTLAGDYGFTQYDRNTTAPQTIIRSTTPVAPANAPVVGPEGTPPLMPTAKQLAPTVAPREDLRGIDQINEYLNQLEADPKVFGYNKELISTLRQLVPLTEIKVKIDNNAKGVGAYNSKTNTVTYNFSLMTKEGYTSNKKASTVLHELIHAYTSKLVKAYKREELENITPEQLEILNSLENLRRTYLNNLFATGRGEAYNIAAEKYIAWAKRKGDANLPDLGTLTPEELSEFYGAMKLEEFITMALTDDDFQRLLNGIKSPNGKSLWKNFVEALANLLASALGFKVDSTSMLPQAINDSINLMKTYTKPAIEEITITPAQPSTSVKEGVSELFESNPELANIGTQKQYSQYIDSIFPDSKVKDLLVHVSKVSGIEKFEISKNTSGNFMNSQVLGSGIYFAPAYLADYWSMELGFIDDITGKYRSNRNLYYAILNAKSPEYFTKNYIEDNQVNSKTDVVVNNSRVTNKPEEYVIKNPEIIHILGSKQDIEGFKNFVSTQSSTSVNEGVKELFNTKIDQYNYSYNPSTQEVIHKAKTGNKVETNETQINKVLVQYALANNFEQRTFNNSSYIQINHEGYYRVLNIKNANEVNPETWEKAEGKVINEKEEIKVPINTATTLNINGIQINTEGLVLNNQQVNALQNIGNFIDSVIKGDVTADDISYTLQGYAGTGKTTITKFILQYLDKKHKGYTLTSPTHRAKEVLNRATGKSAMTLAKALGLAPGVELDDFNLQDKIFLQKNAIKVVSNGILVIDESSMINDALYETILKVAAGKGTKVLFIGDEGQLKPVKQRTKARPFIRTNNISKLTQVMRTADGNPMPSEVLQPIRDNPNSRADMFDHTTTLSPKNEGIIFTNDSNKWLDDMLDKFTLEQLNKNPNYARALAYTNARVEELNTAIRTKMFGFGADTFYPGEIMMMYENLKSLPSGDYMYSNGADVIIDTINFTTDKKIVSPLGGEFTVVGYNISFLDATTNTPKGENLFIADMNTVNKEYLKELGILKTRAISAPANRRGEYWTDYYTFSSKYNLTDNIYEIQGVVYTNENVAFKALVNIAPSSKKKDLGKFKVKDKSINYAYAHTIHKSQGGTYDYAFVDENNIDIASKFENPDYEMINQLKYVGFSRSSKVTEVLSSKTGKTKGIATTAEEVPLPPDELQNLNNLFDEDNLPLTARKMEEFKLICKK